MASWPSGLRRGTQAFTSTFSCGFPSSLRAQVRTLSMLDFFPFAAASAALILVIGPDFYTIMNANVNHERYTQSIAMIHSQYQLNAVN